MRSTTLDAIKNCGVFHSISEVKKQALAQLNAPGLQGGIALKKDRSKGAGISEPEEPIVIGSDSDDDELCIQIGE